MPKDLILNNIKIKWLGHASFKIEVDSKVIYIDPYRIKDEKKADLILITHSHFDHKDEESIESLKKEGTVVLIGGENIKENEEREINGIKIKTIPAYNLNKSFHPKGSGVGFIVDISGFKIYHAGDTDKIEEMAELENQIDVALLPIGGTYTMDLKEAAEAVKMIKPKMVIPIHYKTFKEIEADPIEFKKIVEKICKVEILE
jgi:L-ascorbate metabolism protein UlaG (beta-lactamase superfamily)